MSAKKWRQEQEKRQRILENDVVYIDNMRASIKAKHEGRITAQQFAMVHDWCQRAALRRHEREV